MNRSLAALAFASLLSPVIKAQEKDQPNILLFLVDDMGWQDTSVPFSGDTTAYNRQFHTPAMERLAAEGKIFTQAYACPLSSASRCSLMTGINNARHKVTNWTLHRNRTTDLPNDTVDLPEWNLNGIQPVEGVERSFVARSYVQGLHNAGYRTIHVGKAHFGAKNTPGEDPLNWGFDVNITGTGAGGLATYLSEQRYGHDEDGKPLSPMSTPGLEKYWNSGTFLTEALTQEAISELEKARKEHPEKPWFLNMAHYAVHIPIDRDSRFFQKYKARGLSDKEAAYSSLVEGMDKSLGDLLCYLDSTKQAENTVVMFLSDNGGLATQPEWRDGEPFTQNAPLSSGKGSMHEGGVRIPMIVRWPGKTAPASATDYPVIIEDYFPTLLEISCNSDSTLTAGIDGKSFTRLLMEEKPAAEPEERSLIWNFPNVWGNNGPGINLNCAIRRGPWKLIYYYTDGRKELFNIDLDISEKENLAGKYPDMVAELSKELGNRLREAGAQRPTYKATGKPCSWPDE